MTVTDDEILEHAETAFMLLPALEGRIQVLSVPGVAARLTDVDFPLANMITAARLNTDNADAAIQRLLDHYKSAARPCMWLVGPHSTPADLVDRLVANGFVPVGKLDILVLRDIAKPMAVPDDVVIDEVETKDLHQYDEMMAASYGLPLDVMELFNSCYGDSTGEPRARAYVASVDGVPVSFGLTLYIPNSDLVLLAGAGTAEAHRGRGIYSALVARRLADARADGMATAFIQAVQETSAPICRKLGFEGLGEIQMLVRPVEV